MIEAENKRLNRAAVFLTIDQGNSGPIKWMSPEEIQIRFKKQLTISE